SEATEPTIVITGPQTPAPASAISPMPAMLPMYIRSTMLYRTLTNWASMLGMATRQTSLPIGSSPRSFSCLIDIPSPQKKYIAACRETRHAAKGATAAHCRRSLSLQIPAHQRGDGGFGGQFAVKNAPHGLDNRHLDLILA